MDTLVGNSSFVCGNDASHVKISGIMEVQGSLIWKSIQSQREKRDLAIWVVQR